MDADIAQAFIELYTGWLLSENTMTELYIGEIPSFVHWAPLFAAPTITNMKTDVVLDEDDDFLWTEAGGIVLLTYQRAGVWEIEYTAGYTGVNPAPAGLTALQSEIEAIAFSTVGSVGEETLGDYSYRLTRDIRLARPDILNMLDAYKRWVL